MFQLKQEERVNQMLSKGKNHIQDIKFTKKFTNLNPQNQHLKYQANLDNFYNDKRIQTITEN